MIYTCESRGPRLPSWYQVKHFTALLAVFWVSTGCVEAGTWLRYYHIAKPEIRHVVKSGVTDITCVADGGDRLLILAKGGKVLQCHDVKLGLQWAISSDGPATSGSLTLHEGFLYYVASDGRLRKVDGRTGNIVWNVPVPTPEPDFETRALPIVNGRSLIVSGGSTGWLHWFDEAGGSLIRTVKWPRSLQSRPVLHQDRLFASDSEGTLRCLNVHTGDSLWEERLNREIGDLCVSGDALYFQTPDLFKYSLTGRQIWRVYFDFMGCVVVRKGRVLVTEWGKVVSFNERDGAYCDVLYLNPCTHSGDMDSNASACRGFGDFQRGLAVVTQSGGIYGVNGDFMESPWTVSLDEKHGKKIVWASVQQKGRVLVAFETAVVVVLEIVPNEREEGEDRW